jgi:hypothetical protein
LKENSSDRNSYRELWLYFFLPTIPENRNENESTIPIAIGTQNLYDKPELNSRNHGGNTEGTAHGEHHVFCGLRRTESWYDAAESEILQSRHFFKKYYGYIELTPLGVTLF